MNLPAILRQISLMYNIFNNNLLIDETVNSTKNSNCGVKFWKVKGLRLNIRNAISRIMKLMK